MRHRLVLGFLFSKLAMDACVIGSCCKRSALLGIFVRGLGRFLRRKLPASISQNIAMCILLITGISSLCWLISILVSKTLRGVLINLFTSYKFVEVMLP
jgi:hypothetical protein